MVTVLPAFCSMRRGVMLVSCFRACVIANGQTPVSGPPPLTVLFTNRSAGDYTTAQWDFGNGQSYNGASPLPQLYSSTGSYTVTLTVGDGIDTSTVTRKEYIRVLYYVFLPVATRP